MGKRTDFEDRLFERAGLTLEEARGLIRDGMKAGVSKEEALRRAFQLENYELAELIKEEYEEEEGQSNGRISARRGTVFTGLGRLSQPGGRSDPCISADQVESCVLLPSADAWV